MNGFKERQKESERHEEKDVEDVELGREKFEKMFLNFKLEMVREKENKIKIQSK
jgi:hypothetical protein